MTAYVDTSVLVAVYLPERHSGAARRAVARLPQVPFTALHRLELRNALELLLGRGQVTVAERDAVLELVEADRRARRLAMVAFDWDRVFERAVAVAAQHSASALSRSLDVLHVAAALELGCAAFVTADRRQAVVAAAVGMALTDVTRARGGHA